MNITDQLLTELQEFLQKASLETYAGGGSREEQPERLGHTELVFDEGLWKYRDSYSGYFQSWGQEILSYDGSVLWTQIYGGGMNKEFHGDGEFTNRTFEFLKKVMRTKETLFQPRGP